MLESDYEELDTGTDSDIRFKRNSATVRSQDQSRLVVPITDDMVGEPPELLHYTIDCYFAGGGIVPSKLNLNIPNPIGVITIFDDDQGESLV